MGSADALFGGDDAVFGCDVAVADGVGDRAAGGQYRRYTRREDRCTAGAGCGRGQRPGPVQLSEQLVGGVQHRCRGLDLTGRQFELHVETERCSAVGYLPVPHHRDTGARVEK
nr:hypothetical protein [Rhodococcus sp. EPR-157]